MVKTHRQIVQCPHRLHGSVPLSRLSRVLGLMTAYHSLFITSQCMILQLSKQLAVNQNTPQSFISHAFIRVVIPTPTSSVPHPPSPYNAQHCATFSRGITIKNQYLTIFNFMLPYRLFWSGFTSPKKRNVRLFMY